MAGGRSEGGDTRLFFGLVERALGGDPLGAYGHGFPGGLGTEVPLADIVEIAVGGGGAGFVGAGAEQFDFGHRRGCPRWGKREGHAKTAAPDGTAASGSGQSAAWRLTAAILPRRSCSSS